jgi:tRNA(Ile)-lysidine synthase
MRESIAPKVLAFIQKNALTERERPLLVAVSGGPDSVCLLHLLHSLRGQLGISLHVAHLDHRLRDDSEDDARYVGELARQFQLPATIGQRDVKSYQKKHRQSLEEAAREVRYHFLAEVAGNIGASRVAVAHTRDDHVETILLHLVRGSGTRGLRGLLPLTEWRGKSREENTTIIRPLLEISREDTQSYCTEHNLNPRLDVSNLSLSPLRNRLRHQLLPMLRSYNPGVTEALVRLSRIAGDDLAYLESEAAALWPSIAEEREDTVSFHRASFNQLPVALKRYLLRLALERLLGDLKDIETRHLEEIMNMLDKPAGRKISLPGGLYFLNDYDRYRLTPDIPALTPYPVLDGETTLNVPGVTLAAGWRIEASVITHQEMKPGDDNFTAYFDFEQTGSELFLRARRRGDRFQPLGLAALKKVGEFMIDAKIPFYLRDRVPLVGSRDKIIWLVGYRIDERVKVTENSRQILRLEFKRTTSPA